MVCLQTAYSSLIWEGNSNSLDFRYNLTKPYKDAIRPNINAVKQLDDSFEPGVAWESQHILKYSSTRTVKVSSRMPRLLNQRARDQGPTSWQPEHTKPNDVQVRYVGKPLLHFVSIKSQFVIRLAIRTMSVAEHDRMKIKSKRTHRLVQQWLQKLRFKFYIYVRPIPKLGVNVNIT